MRGIEILPLNGYLWQVRPCKKAFINLQRGGDDALSQMANIVQYW